MGRKLVAQSLAHVPVAQVFLSVISWQAGLSRVQAQHVFFYYYLGGEKRWFGSQNPAMR